MSRDKAHSLTGAGPHEEVAWHIRAPHPRKGLGSRPGMKPLSCTLTRSTTQANPALGCWVLARGLQRNAALSLTTVPASRKHKALLCTKKMLSLRAPGSRAGFLGVQAVKSHAPPTTLRRAPGWVPSSAAAFLPFLIIFEQGAPLFHLVLGPLSGVLDPGFRVRGNRLCRLLGHPEEFPGG